MDHFDLLKEIGGKEDKFFYGARKYREVYICGMEGFFCSLFREL
jgi:hypothetical protein